jgi:predicted nucleotidyltransferase component of viral defense system
MKAKTYQTAEAFRIALETRLAALAVSSGMSIERLRQQVAFDRFLARLFQGDDDPDFILKGGYAMELRLRHRARFSRDLDLCARHEKAASSAEEIQSRLQDPISKELGDWFAFQIGESTMDLEGAPDAGFRFPVDARLAGRTFAKFHVDVGIGDAVLDDPVWLKGNSLLTFAGIPDVSIALLPAETHFAEKIHAYTRPRERLNSRVRDLIDIVLLLDEGLKDLEAAHRSLESTFRRRDTHSLPKELPAPHPTWTKVYANLASEIGLKSAPTSDEAFEKLAAFWKKLFPKT